MMSQPAYGTNIHTIWTKVLTNDLLSYSQIKEKLVKNFPEINPNSFHVHVKSLIKSNLVQKDILPNGQTGFRLIESQQSLLPEEENNNKKKKNTRPVITNSTKILTFLKKQIGKQFSAGDITRRLKFNGSAAWDIMKAFEYAGYLESDMINKKMVYTVLPTIKDCITPPSINHVKNKKAVNNKKKKQAPNQTLVKAPEKPIQMEQTSFLQEDNNSAPNIMNMNVGELVTNAVHTYNENVKLKQTLNTIAHLLLDAGIVEE